MDTLTLTYDRGDARTLPSVTFAYASDTPVTYYRRSKGTWVTPTGMGLSDLLVGAAEFLHMMDV